jgi:cell division septation protein DedD
MAIAAVFALAVIGTAGAFGYRALFGSSGSGGPTPVIKADATPSKIVPATRTRDPQNNKLIYDRVNERGQGEKVVSREEQPVEMNDKSAGVGFPNGQAAQSYAAQPQSVGSGIVGMEPKKVHTIAIRPDQVATAGNAPPPAAAAPARQPAPNRVVANAQPANDPPPVRRQTVAANAMKPERQAAAPARGNAPLSLNPDEPPPPAVRSNPPVMRTASAAPPTQTAPAATTRTRSIAAGSTGAYAVQVSSQRSEAEAQTAFQSLQAKYPSQLGGRQPVIHRVDLGEKGIYFRAMVGPFASSNEAGELCSSLKAVGGSCIVQRN